MQTGREELVMATEGQQWPRETSKWRNRRQKGSMGSGHYGMKAHQ